MSKIISISMDEALAGEIEKLQKDGFSGRSEIFRRGLKYMLEDSKSMENLRGHVDCIMFAMHSRAEDKFSKILHKDDDLIKTQLHSKFCNDKCLEIFVLHGESGRIKNLYNSLKKNKSIDYLKLIVP